MDHILYFLLIGLLAGWITGKILKGRGFGVVGDMIVGCIGSMVGGFVFGLLGLHAYSLLGNLVCAVIGSLVFLWLLRFIRRGPV